MTEEKQVMLIDGQGEDSIWLNSRLSAVIHRAVKKEILYFLTGDVDVLTQLGWIKCNTSIYVVGVFENLDAMLEGWEKIELAGSILPDHFYILDRPVAFAFKHADYLTYIGTDLPAAVKQIGIPVVFINPELKEVNWIINGKFKPFS